MELTTLIEAARAQGASDLHLEPGLPAALRIRGTLRMLGSPLPRKLMLEAAQEVVGVENWPRFLERRSYDLSKTISGVRCRINVMQSSRGVGMAIRLLSTFQATLERLNLHPDLRRFISHTNGLILISGPTGSGKSSTMAAMIQEINLQEARHVVTIESPIEYQFRPHRAYIRQREVGRDTPSFEQALIDAMREDPDVLMVGEMRDPETMRLTLNAAETGHLVLATTHSSSACEAVQRVISAFPAEIQGSVCGQLADCLVAVIAQRLVYRPDLKIQVPECEVLVPTHSVKNFIRRNEHFKIVSAMETGAEHGMWTYARYRTWLEGRKQWHLPGTKVEDEGAGVEALEAEDSKPMSLPPLIVGCGPSAATHSSRSAPASPAEPKPSPVRGNSIRPLERAVEIEPVEGGLDAIISTLRSKP